MWRVIFFQSHMCHVHVLRSCLDLGAEQRPLQDERLPEPISAGQVQETTAQNGESCRAKSPENVLLIIKLRDQRQFHNSGNNCERLFVGNAFLQYLHWTY